MSQCEVGWRTYEDAGEKTASAKPAVVGEGRSAYEDIKRQLVKAGGGLGGWEEGRGMGQMDARTKNPGGGEEDREEMKGERGQIGDKRGFGRVRRDDEFHG